MEAYADHIKESTLHNRRQKVHDRVVTYIDNNKTLRRLLEDWDDLEIEDE